MLYVASKGTKPKPVDASIAHVLHLRGEGFKSKRKPKLIAAAEIF
jgi:hypothetical protein